MTSTDIEQAGIATRHTEPEAGTAGEESGGVAVEVERLPGSQASLRVEVSPDAVRAAVAHALRHLSRRVRLPGFRPGKAPAAFVERAVGWPAVVRETLDEFVPSWYVLALRQADLDAVGDPEFSLGELEKDTRFTFSVTTTVSPEVDLGDYLTIRVDQPRTEITEAQVDDSIEEVRRGHAELREVDRPAQAGDLLRARLVMRRGGEPVGGDDAERDIELDRDRLLPGLADGLIGLRAGEQHQIQITLPDDYPQEEMRGAEVAVDASVVAVRERDLPPLDDTLAVLDGHGTTLDELRSHHRRRLEEAAEREDDQAFEAEVLQRLRDTAVLEIPAVMVDREVDRQVRDMEARLAQMGLRLDRYLELSGETLEQVREQRREPAAQRVRLELVLEKLAAEEGLELDESDVEREEARLTAGARLTDEQRRRLHLAAHRDLLLQGAAQRAMAIARGE